MTLNLLIQLGVIPAILIALMGVIILRGEDKERNARRFLLFLLGVGMFILLALVVTMRFISGNDPQLYFQLAWLLAPSLLGILALILLYAKTGLTNMDRKARMTAGVLGLALIILFALTWNPQFGIEFFILSGALILALGWAWGMRRVWLAIVLSLLCLGALGLFSFYLSHPPDYTAGSPPFAQRALFLFGLGFNIWPGLAVVMSGVQMTFGLQSPGAQGENTTPASSRRMRLFMAGLAFAVLFYLAYSVFWGSVWDQTSDGLSGIFLSQLSGLIGIGTGMIMMLVLRGRNRLAGIIFMIVVPVMLNQTFEAGWRVSYHEITEARSARIARALERFHAREGYYPESLEVLAPRDLLLVQQPVILAGEEWCYEGGENYYRLSAFYREFFSAPVSLRVYESAGEPPAMPSACESRLAEMKEKYYSPIEDPNAMRPSLPTPLPEIEVDVPKTELQPVLGGAVALPGSWSPDGAYFLFGTQTDNLALHFLIGETGEVCTADIHFSNADGIRENSAWLPDGRLLYVESTGEMMILTPCQLDSEILTVHPPDAFDRVLSYSKESGRILLKSQSGFWIMDGRTLEMMHIPDFMPNPYEFHWDTSTWLPGGEQLVIARLNGQKGSNEGTTLYLIDGITGEVQNSLILDGEFGQSSPWIEGVSETEVLVHSQGELLIVDLSVQPVKITNVLEDIFGLDIKYPDEVSAAGSHIGDATDDYYLAVRLNHPRNQSTYLYHSQTERVYVYDHAYHTLLLFPDGYLMEMAKQELVPTYRDEYDVVMVDTADTVQPRLMLTGHTPREYPHLSLVYLVKRSQLAVASAHGVSLVSLPDGKMKAYWSLVGDGYSPWITASPDVSALVAVKDFGGLYYIPLSSVK